MRRLFPALVGFALLAVAGAASAELRLETDKRKLNIEEIIEVRLISTSTSASKAPEEAEFLKDFSIVERSSSRQTLLSNGVTTVKNLWRYQLAPKRTGRLRIGGIKVAGETSNSLKFEVAAAAQKKPGNILIQGSVDRHRQYVNGQIIYTLRLLVGRNSYRGGISELRAKDVEVRLIEKEKRYLTQYRGAEYQAIEWRYALFPKSSGKVTLAPLTFNGRKDGSNKRVRISTRAIDLKILSLAPSFPASSQWITAADLRLEDKWKPKNAQAFKVGVPISREVVLRATGSAVGHLQQMAMSSPTEIEAFPEKARHESSKSAKKGVVGVFRQSWTLIPRVAGEFELPAMPIHWWDYNNHQLQTAELPARRIRVVDANAAGASAVQPPPDSGVTIEEAEGEKGPSPSPPAPQAAASSAWIWATAIGWGAFLSSIGFVLLPRIRRRRAALLAARAVDPARAKPSKDLLRLCRAHEARGAYDLWLRHRQRFEAECPLELRGDLQRCIRQLAASLYGDSGGRWNGKAMGEIVAKFRVERPAKEKTAPLPPLYPRTA